MAQQGGDEVSRGNHVYARGQDWNNNHVYARHQTLQALFVQASGSINYDVARVFRDRIVPKLGIGYAAELVQRQPFDSRQVLRAPVKPAQR